MMFKITKDTTNSSDIALVVHDISKINLNMGIEI